MLRDDGDDGVGFQRHLRRVDTGPTEVELTPLLQRAHGAGKHVGPVTKDRALLVDAESSGV